VLLVSIGALAVASTPDRAGAADVDDLILRIGTVEDLDSINPNLAFVDTSAEATMLAYDSLVGFGPGMDYVPGFAEAWTAAGRTWTFTIRDGMRWSDGRVADANDAAFTFRYLLASMDPTYAGPWAPDGNDVPRSGATRGDGRPDHPLSLYGEVLVDAVGLRTVDLVDDHTVTLTTAEPTTLLLGALVPILPAHIWATVPFAEAATTFQAEPPVVGSGAFQPSLWRRGSSVRFVRNSFYWGGQPAIDAVELRVYPDQRAMAAALRRGDIDYARGIAPSDVAALDRDDDIVLAVGPAAGFTHLAFNAYPRAIDGGGASTGAVRDPAFRDALGYALDQDEIIEMARDGHATPGSTLIPPAVVPFHAEPSRPRRFDPREAAVRLDAAGYRDTDGDGTREDLDGRTIDLRLVYPTSDPSYAAAAVAVAAGWEEVGVGVTVNGLEPDTLTELLYVPEAGGTADYDVELWSWTGSPDPDFLLSLLTTAEIGGWSDSNYANPAYDDLFADQRRAATVEDRQAIVRRMLDLAYDDAPYHVLYYDDELDAHRTDRFEGWATQPGGGASLFTNSVGSYLSLRPASAAASPSPDPTLAAPGPSDPVAPSPPRSVGVGEGLVSGEATVGLGALLTAIAAGILVMVGRRIRRGRALD
jgi:peptide/nickel transport system substrate-binding protein